MILLQALGRYLIGRSRRRDYWVWLAFLAGLLICIPFAPFPDILSWGLLTLWPLAASRRLRAMGWIPWLSIAPIVLLFALFVTLRALTPSLTNALDIHQRIIALFGLVWLAFALLLGFWPSRKTKAPTPQAQAEVFG
jgi:hypothetical protein